MSGREVNECNKRVAQIIDEVNEGIKQRRYDYCAMADKEV